MVRKKPNPKYDARKAAGRCPSCGGERDVPGITCSECRRKSRESKVQRVIEGRCRTCGDPLHPNHPYLCKRCLLVEQHKTISEDSKKVILTKQKNVHQLTRRQREGTIRVDARESVFDVYGGRCSCCGSDERAFLQVHHKAGKGNEHRRQLHKPAGSTFYKWIVQHGYPDNLTLLCANCHQALHRFGRCSHPKTWVPTYTVETPRVNDYVPCMSPALVDLECKDPLAIPLDPLQQSFDPMAHLER